MYNCAFFCLLLKLSHKYLFAADKLLIQEDPALYYFINQGCLTVDNMNDKEEMELVDVSIGQFQFKRCRS